MKNKFCIAAILVIIIVGHAEAQKTNIAFKDTTYQTATTAVSADTKKTFWDFLGTVGGVLNNTSTGFSLNPTFDKLGLKKWGTNDEIAKRLQFNFTPVAKGSNFFKYDSLSFGFTYTILNDFSRQRWNKMVVNNSSVQAAFNFRTQFSYLAENNYYIQNQFHHPPYTGIDSLKIANLEALVDSNKVKLPDLKNIPPGFRYAIFLIMVNNKSEVPVEITTNPQFSKFLTDDKSCFYAEDKARIPANISANDQNLIDLIIIAEFQQTATVLSSLTKNFLNKAPQITLAANTIENFVKDRLQGYYATLSVTQYFGKGAHFSAVLKSTYSVEDDTLKAGNNDNRQLSKNNIGIDWLSPFGTKNYAKQSPLEFKVASEFDWLAAGTHYKKEKTLNISPELDVTLNLTDKISLPIAIKYDQSKSSMFGFINFQYAVGSKK